MGLADDADESRALLADQFLDTMRDWGELSGELADSLVKTRSAKSSIALALDELHASGMLLLGGRRRLRVTGGVMRPGEWSQAVLQVVEADPSPSQAAHDAAASHVGLRSLGPNAWCVPSPGNQGELALRVLYAVPGAVSLHDNGTAVSLLRGEAREDALLRLLKNSLLDDLIREQQASWRWETLGGWEIVGSGNVELTTVRYDVGWPYATARPPFGAFVTVLTGWTDGAEGTKSPGVLMALDMTFNVIELTASRGRSDIAYRTTPPPAPGALTLNEVASLTTRLVQAGELVRDVAAELLPTGANGSSGAVGLWLAVNGVELQRVVDLSELPRLRESTSLGSCVHTASWPLASVQSDAGSAASHFVAAFYEDLLERSGYRGLRDRIEAIKESRTGDPATPA
jgi:hypothetical protein